MLSNRPKIKDSTRWLKVKGANHLPIPYLGYVEVDVTLAGKTFEKVGMLVVKDPTDDSEKKRKAHCPGILGSNLLHIMRENQEEVTDPSTNITSLIFPECKDNHCSVIC